MPSDGASDDHGDDGEVLNLEKKKEKNKTLWRSRQRYCLGF